MGIFHTYSEIHDRVLTSSNPDLNPFKLREEDGMYQVYYVHADTDEIVTMGDEDTWYDLNDAQQMQSSLNLAFALGEHSGANNPYC